MGLDRSGSLNRPGRLVLVVGPSGAGKDALISGARQRLRSDDRYAFPERIVTRPSTAAEHHATADETTFVTAEASGSFAFSWRAHGLAYGLPASINTSIQQGRVVVANVSRGVVTKARRLYPDALVILIDAPLAIRAARIALRGRETSEEIAERLARTASDFTTKDADMCIENTGSIEEGVEALLNAITGIAAHA